jgi:hypothetical protein
MTPEEIEIGAKETKERGRLVEQLLSSKGWAVYKEVVHRKLQFYCDINKLHTVEDLEVAKKLQKIIAEIEGELAGIVDEAARAEETLQQLNKPK